VEVSLGTTAPVTVEAAAAKLAALSDDELAALGYHVNRGNAHAQLREEEKALADYNKAVQLDPGSATALIARRYFFAGQGKYDLALADYDKGIAIDPRKVDGYLDRGGAHWKRKKYRLTIADWSKVVETSPGDYLGHCNLAWAQATCPDPKFRNGQEALKHATEACALSKQKSGRCLETLAAAHAENGNFVQAVKSAMGTSSCREWELA
jgi:tetratricopeptide (TPR) repeat protein